MKIFITGGTGFIGRYVVKLLQKKNHRLLLLSREPKKAKTLFEQKSILWLEGDLGKIKNLKSKIAKFKPEAAIHLAWEGIPDASFKTSLNNFKYSLELLEILAAIGCNKVLCAGSCGEYGQVSGKISEAQPLKPLNALFAAKAAVLWLGQQFAKENNLEFIWVRPFYVYGPGQRSSSLIPYIIQSIQKGEAPQLKNPKGGNDFVYVEDVGQAITTIIEKHRKTQSNIYNIGSGKLTSVAVIASLVYNLYRLKCPIKPPKKTEGFCADISRIVKEIGWQPKTSIKDGIQNTVAYFEKIKNG